MHRSTNRQTKTDVRQWLLLLSQSQTRTLQGQLPSRDLISRRNASHKSNKESVQLQTTQPRPSIDLITATWRDLMSDAGQALTFAAVTRFIAQPTTNCKHHCSLAIPSNQQQLIPTLPDTLQVCNLLTCPYYLPRNSLQFSLVHIECPYHSV